MRSDEQLLSMNYLRYRNSAAITTLVFIIIGTLCSHFGLTSIHIDLSHFGGDGLTGILIALGFVIAINERIMELVTKTYRRNTGAVIELRMSLSSPSDKQSWDELYLGYKAETGRLVLTLSLVFGCSLASLGFFRILGGLNIEEMMSSATHHLLFDAADVVITGWTIAGGSQGYYKLIEMISNTLKFKTDLEKTSASKLTTAPATAPVIKPQT